MYRYLALIWDGSDPDRSSVAHSLTARLLLPSSRRSPSHWTKAFEGGGIVVVHTGLAEGAAQTRRLDDSAGVVLGTVFSRNLESVEDSRRVCFDLPETKRIVADSAARLFGNYWGRYVAMVRNAQTQEICVLRDPMGGLPCLLASCSGVSVVCSDLECLLRLGGTGFTVDWSYIAGLLRNPGLATRSTGLREVSEIRPGERVCFGGGAIRRSMAWNPLEISRAERIQDADDAADRLRATARACIHAWASYYPSIIHNLSGGIDSSIVLACLKDAPTQPRVTCLNYFGTGPSEDERTHARLVAQHVGARLLECGLDCANVRLEKITTLKRSARPWFYLYELEHGELEDQLAAQHGAGTVFSGSGGDGVFFQGHADLAVADYLFDHAPGRGLLSAAVDAAEVSRRSIWPLLWGAIRMRVLPGRFDPYSERPQRTLIGAAALAAASPGNADEESGRIAGRAMRAVPPGSLWHVSTVAVPPAYYGSFGPEIAPERTMPLLSQPLVELCFRIPSYLMIRGGRDRALVRKAFAADLPRQTLMRTGKGRIDRHLRDLLDANLGFVREFLLDGILAGRGFLDRRNLDLSLGRDRPPTDFQCGEILQQHLCTEAWLRRSLEARVPPATEGRQWPARAAGDAGRTVEGRKLR